MSILKYPVHLPLGRPVECVVGYVEDFNPKGKGCYFCYFYAKTNSHLIHFGFKLEKRTFNELLIYLKPLNYLTANSTICLKTLMNIWLE